MKGYLAPLHYGLHCLITWLCGDPIMSGHWVMLLQILLATGFLFSAVRHVAGTFPAFFSVLWLLHTRHLIQRMTGGLPRGWVPVLVAAYLFFALTGRHRGMLTVLAAACLLNPPVAFVITVAYAFMLIALTAKEGVTRSAIRRWVAFLLCGAGCAVMTVAIVRRPESVGQMVTKEIGMDIPALQRGGDGRPGGRFPFLPLRPMSEEIPIVGFQAFIGKLVGPTRLEREILPWLIGLGLITILALGYQRKLSTIPLPVYTLGAAALITYVAARVFAFRLYVPDRHLQSPLAFFLICGFTIGTWRALRRRGISDRSLQTSKPTYPQVAALVLVTFWDEKGIPHVRDDPPVLSRILSRNGASPRSGVQGVLFTRPFSARRLHAGSEGRLLRISPR